jgi:hypothetical protein
MARLNWRVRWAVIVLVSIPLATGSFLIGSGIPAASASSPVGFNTPVSIDPAQGVINSVSCTSATFCAAVDAGGHAAVETNGTWGQTKLVDPGRQLMSVSCTTDAVSNVCVAVDDGGNQLTYSNGTWSPPTAIDAPQSLSSVSCASPSLCVAVDQSGQFLIDTAGSWSTPAPIVPGSFFGNLSGVACGSPTFCVAVDLLGNAFTYNGTTNTWAPATGDPVDTHELTAISCPTSSFCAAVDSFGELLTDTAGTWKSFLIDSSPLGSVSCSSASLCVATDLNGVAVPFTGFANPRTTQLGTQFGTMPISCPSAAPTFCTAGDTTGHAITFDPSTLPATSNPAPSSFLEAVSCVGTQFCEAFDDVGHAFTYNGTSWSGPQATGSAGLAGLSCESTTK